MARERVLRDPALGREQVHVDRDAAHPQPDQPWPAPDPHPPHLDAATPTCDGVPRLVPTHPQRHPEQRDRDRQGPLGGRRLVHVERSREQDHEVVDVDPDHDADDLDGCLDDPGCERAHHDRVGLLRHDRSIGSAGSFLKSGPDQPNPLGERRLELEDAAEQTVHEAGRLVGRQAAGQARRPR
ncbi:hypothetical protein GCM10025868_03640 [Angustibacter aerolatus]|uniref:Uncharacterized protein n=1 Tax=Angustibacter aerolatus TaxID=1162965 RepID=A0ABQ6JD46_9ACTN|nr:hypothetical protein GCM10025868_03640 [Angustibacter aerolatus]